MRCSAVLALVIIVAIVHGTCERASSVTDVFHSTEVSVTFMLQSVRALRRSLEGLRVHRQRPGTGTHQKERQGKDRMHSVCVSVMHTRISAVRTRMSCSRFSSFHLPLRPFLDRARPSSSWVRSLALTVPHGRTAHVAVSRVRVALAPGTRAARSRSAKPCGRKTPADWSTLTSRSRGAAMPGAMSTRRHARMRSR